MAPSLPKCAPGPAPIPPSDREGRPQSESPEQPAPAPICSPVRARYACQACPEECDQPMTPPRRRKAGGSVPTKGTFDTADAFRPPSEQLRCGSLASRAGFGGSRRIRLVRSGRAIPRQGQAEERFGQNRGQTDLVARYLATREPRSGLSKAIPTAAPQPRATRRRRA